jgi:malate dehydrogenase
MKVTVVGAGNVGATVSECVARKDMVKEVIMIDIVEGMPQGKALDMWQSAPIHLFDTRITGTNNYEDTAGSDICVITAGLPRKPGMSRDDLLTKNAGIVRSVTEQLAAQSPDTILIVVSNPLDVMTYVAYMASGFPSRRVVGMAGVLDTARYRAFLAMELNVSVRDIQAMLMGGHGDTMVPLPSCTSVGGIPVTKLIDQQRLEKIIDRTRSGGAEIVSLLKTGSAYYAPAAATAQMVEAIVRDKHRLIPCAAYCDREYGVGGYYVGVPVVLDAGGVERVVEMELDDQERAAFQKSVHAVKELVAKMDELLGQPG